MNVAHKIELIPNNKAKTHFKKAFGCARLAYNWGLAEWEKSYKQGFKVSHYDLMKKFNAIKYEEFPFVTEVSKCVVQRPFFHLNEAFQRFFKKQGGHPNFKRKRDNQGSFYLDNCNVKIQGKYVHIPKLGLVKMTQELRFQGKINSAVISQRADKYYVSFNMEISKEEYQKTHKNPIINEASIGIDLGIRNFASLSNGLFIANPKPLDKFERSIKRLSRQLERKRHPKTKGDLTLKSANYKKASFKLAKKQLKVRNIRKDMQHKLSSLLVRHYKYIGLETLGIQDMVKKASVKEPTVENFIKRKQVAKGFLDTGCYEFRQMIEYKAKYNGKEVVLADKDYPSTNTCSICGNVKPIELGVKTYHCDKCGAKLDRDYNAAINLHKLANQQIGRVPSEFTPADLTALLEDLAINRIATSKVETGIQQKSYL